MYSMMIQSEVPTTYDPKYWVSWAHWQLESTEIS
jgi:hypothetical protein